MSYERPYFHGCGGGKQSKRGSGIEQVSPCSHCNDSEKFIILKYSQILCVKKPVFALLLFVQ